MLDQPQLRRRGPASRLFALLLVVLAAGVAVPASASGAEKAIWGGLTLPDGRSAFDTYKSLGVDTFQIQLRWADVARARPANPTDPADPAYAWPATIDRAIAEGRRTGVDVAILVTRSPKWANGGRPDAQAPTEPGDYGRFTAAASRRYPSVRKWMIWGEPNKADRFLPSGSAAPPVYARLLDSAYGALKGVSSKNIVIGGMTWTGGEIKPANFLGAMKLPNGKRPRLDWFGHNPFPFRFPNLDEIPIPGGWRDISDIDTYAKEIRHAYGRPKPLWLSEFTVQSDRASDAFTLAVSQADQARWLTAAFDAADAIPNVAGMGWLNLTDQTPKRNSSNWGLLTATGAVKPAFTAYRQARNARLRPAVRAAKRIRKTSLQGRGLGVRIRPRRGGTVVVELKSPKGARVAKTRRRYSANKVGTARLRRRAALRTGTYLLSVRAPGGETVYSDVKVTKR